MARTPPSRGSQAKILAELRRAARKGDRAALSLALDQMRTLALSPRYWEKYLTLLGNPLARLVDLLAIKQGDRIAQQKGWKKPGGGLRPPSSSAGATSPARPRGATTPSEASPRAGLRRRSRRAKGRSQPRRRSTGPEQPSLFDP